jgi:hypothetical protein
MLKTITLNNWITCEYLNIYWINVNNWEIETSLYSNETMFNEKKWPIINITVNTNEIDEDNNWMRKSWPWIFTEEHLSQEWKTPKILAEEFLSNYDFSNV